MSAGLGVCPDALPAAKRSARVGITVRVAFEIAQEEIVSLASYDRVGRNEYLAATARRVDAEHWRRISGRMAAKRTDDLDALLDRGTEVSGATDRIALIEVIWLDPSHQEPVHQLLHQHDIVVDAFKKNGLAPQGY